MPNPVSIAPESVSLHHMRQPNKTLQPAAGVAFTAGVYVIVGDCYGVKCNTAGNLVVHYTKDAANKFVTEKFAEGERLGMEIDKIIESGTTVTPLTGIILYSQG